MELTIVEVKAHSDELDIVRGSYSFQTENALGVMDTKRTVRMWMKAGTCKVGEGEVIHLEDSEFTLRKSINKEGISFFWLEPI